jgi:hypothetical protein
VSRAGGTKERAMRVLVAIDDTDALGTRGTGHLAEDVAQAMERNGLGRRSFITRHQLLVHPDVPYTSHNSAMCFTAELWPGAVEPLVALAGAMLERGRAPGSDPGLCVAAPEALERTEDLVAWGRAAKTTVLRKGDAYVLARRVGVHLSEHGGTGQGVVGALAGVGLRLSGMDGRVRGGLVIPSVDGTASAREIRAHPQVRAVLGLGGEVPRDDDRVAPCNLGNAYEPRTRRGSTVRPRLLGEGPPRQPGARPGAGGHLDLATHQRVGPRASGSAAASRVRHDSPRRGPA